MEGGRSICEEAGIPLAGGHSIDCPEPIFGLAVTGACRWTNSKRTPQPTRRRVVPHQALGVGIITTTQKRGNVDPDHLAAAVNSMQTLNAVGAELSALPACTR